MTGVKVIFAHDTEVALAAAAALVNTAPGGVHDEPEELPDVAALDDFVSEWGWTGRMRRDEQELREVRRLRPRLRRLWDADRDEVVEIVNGLLAEARAVPQLVRHDEWDYHLHATSDDDPLWMRMAVEAAMGFIDLVRADGLDRMGTCARDECDDVLVDLSKNRSKRYCNASCSNKAAVAAYRSRRAGA